MADFINLLWIILDGMFHGYVASLNSFILVLLTVAFSVGSRRYIQLVVLFLAAAVISTSIGFIISYIGGNTFSFYEILYVFIMQLLVSLSIGSILYLIKAEFLRPMWRKKLELSSGISVPFWPPCFGELGRTNVAIVLGAVIAAELVGGWLVAIASAPFVGPAQVVILIGALLTPFVEEGARWWIGISRANDQSARVRGLWIYAAGLIIIEALGGIFSVGNSLHWLPIGALFVLLFRGPATFLHIINSIIVSRYAPKLASDRVAFTFLIITFTIHSILNYYAISLWPFFLKWTSGVH